MWCTHGPHMACMGRPVGYSRSIALPAGIYSPLNQAGTLADSTVPWLTHFHDEWGHMPDQIFMIFGPPCLPQGLIDFLTAALDGLVDCQGPVECSVDGVDELRAALQVWGMGARSGSGAGPPARGPQGAAARRRPANEALQAGAEAAVCAALWAAPPLP